MLQIHISTPLYPLRKGAQFTIFLVLFFFFSFNCTSLLAQIDSVAIGTKFPSHPRILLLKGEEDKINKAISSSKTWGAINHLILEKCDLMLNSPALERILEGRRLLSTSRECLHRVFFLSYAWRITKQEKYLREAEKQLLTVSRFSDWNPSHFLDVAEMTTAVAIGYDWLYSDLSLESRNVIKDAILKKGLEPSIEAKNNVWLNVTNNWNQVCNAGMTYGALAIYEDHPEFARKIINRSIKSIKLPMGDYDPDGAYQEGYMYWAYGTTFNVMLIGALEKALGKKYLIPTDAGFLKTAGYLQNVVGPTGLSFNYSDCNLRSDFQPAMFWFADKLKNPSLLWFEHNYDLKAGKKQMMKDRLFPLVMIWSNSINLEQIAAPKNKMWNGRGKTPVTLMRTSWTNPNSIFIGMKGGSPSTNHAHMDIGSFVMDANGIRWAMDFGMEGYNALEVKGVDLWNLKQNSTRWNVFRYKNSSHNTLTVNDELQNVKGFAPIEHHTERPGYMNGVVDLKEIYPQLEKAKRSISILEDRYVEIKDELRTGKSSAKIRWTMLTSATVKIIPQGVELSKDGKKLNVKIEKNPNVTFRTWPTESPQSYESPNPGTTLIGFEITIPANTSAEIQVYLIPESNSKKTK